MSDVTDADREKAHQVLGYTPSTPRTYSAYEYARIQGVAAALAEERERGIDIGLQNATSLDHYEVGHCCRLCGETWPCDRARTVGLQ